MTNSHQLVGNGQLLSRGRRMRNGWLALACAAITTSGCTYQEGLLIQNMRGRVVIPKAAATRDIVNPEGVVETITDVKLIGPVYLGLFPSVFPENVVERYPHPEVGPQFRAGIPGDTYPYGGTSIGDLRFACFEFLVCKVTSGRFLDYQEMVDWFEFIGQPVVDAGGVEVDSGEFIQQTCYDLLNVTRDDEVRITAYEDRNDDDVINRADLDFVEEGDNFVAEFTLWQQEFFWDQDQENCTPGEDCTGFTLWGWMDAPSQQSFQYSTCDPASGFSNTEYNADFEGGSPYPNLLNLPASYIAEGDWVATEGHVWNDVYEIPDLVLDFPVQ